MGRDHISLKERFLFKASLTFCPGELSERAFPRSAAVGWLLAGTPMSAVLFNLRG